MLAKLPVEAESSSSSLSCEEEGEVQEEMMDRCEMDTDSFISTKTELGTINRSLEFIGVRLLKRNMSKNNIICSM